MQGASPEEVEAEVARWEEARAEWPDSWAEAWDQVQAAFTGIPADAEYIVAEWLHMMAVAAEELTALQATVAQLPPERRGGYQVFLSDYTQWFSNVGAGVYSTFKAQSGNEAFTIVGGITISAAAVAWIYATYGEVAKFAIEVQNERVQADADAKVVARRERLGEREGGGIRARVQARRQGKADTLPRHNTVTVSGLTPPVDIQASSPEEVEAEVARWEAGRAEWPESWAEAWDQVQAAFTGIPADAEEVVGAWLDLMAATDEDLTALKATVDQLPPAWRPDYQSRLSTYSQSFNDIGAGVYSTFKAQSGNPAFIIVGGITIAAGAVAWIYYTYEEAERLAVEVQTDRVRADADLLRAQTEQAELAARAELNKQGIELQESTLRDVATPTADNEGNEPPGYDFGWVQGAVGLLIAGVLGLGAYQVMTTRGGR